MKKATSITLITIAALLLFDTLRAQAQPAEDCKIHIVHTQQPRHQTKVGLADDAANLQHVNDISRVWEQAESDVAIDSCGKVTVVHNCTASPDICVAQEARVSPDGKKIVYAVGIGAKLDIAVGIGGIDSGLRDFSTIESQLWLYDIPTGKKRMLTSGHIDRSPVFAANDLIVFASDRAKTYAPRSTLGRNFYPRPAFHIHRLKLTDTGVADVVDITPAEYFAQSPEVTTDGNVLYSSLQGVAPREFGSTPQNHWWICEIDINGGDPRCVLGAHGSGNIINLALIADWADPNRRGEQDTVIRGLRAMAELWPGFIAVTNYYRGNSEGAMGKILGFILQMFEGASYEKNIPAVVHWSKAGEPGSGRFLPSNVTGKDEKGNLIAEPFNLTPFGLDQDLDSPIYHKDGRAAGRAGYPFAVPDSWGFGPDAWGYTRCLGFCADYVTPAKATVTAMGGQPTAKKQIEIALVKQVRNPFDPKQTRVIACADLDRHCYDGRAVATYRDLYGIDTPQIAPIVTPTDCELQVVNARMGELSPAPPPPGASPAKIQELRVAFQGNASPDYPAVVKSFGVEYIDLWKTLPTREGEAKRYPPIKADLLQDGSVRLPVECGRPFQHFGYDAAGEKVASGLMPMAAMGKMTCHGCHDGHSEERSKALQKTAVERYKTTMAGCG